MVKHGPSSKVTGKVKWFHSRKRYGFITSDTAGDVFFHQQQIVNNSRSVPAQDTPVRFHVRDTWRGPEALNVELLEHRPDIDRQEITEKPLSAEANSFADVSGDPTTG
jgi:CspA family cold shock protein